MPITVLLPVCRAGPGLARALAAITTQSHRDLEVLLILNGVTPPERPRILALAEADPRVRLLETPYSNLAHALNLGAAQARHELLARMDDDDTCPPDRLQLQADALNRHPDWVAVGGTWDVVEPDGRTRVTVRPPTDPPRLAWQLHLGNCLAHGSMMLRRSALAAIGGYNPGFPKAQDHELWLRFVRAGARIGALPQTIYRHHLRTADAWCTTPEQAACESFLLSSAWTSLPEGPGPALQHAIAESLRQPGSTDAVETILDQTGPSRFGLMTWLWQQWLSPRTERRAFDLCRLARFREITRELRDDGVDAVWLWGAGNHTRWILEHADDVGVRIAGIVDDALAGRTCFGHRVRGPETLGPTDVVLISSDRFEDQIWANAAPLRERGVRVLRFYAQPAPTEASS